MFDQLTDRLQKTFHTLRGKGKIREGNIHDALEEVKTSLLEADVQYRVVQSFVDSVRVRALGQEVLHSLEPGQVFTKILFDELKKLLGDTEHEISDSKSSPTVILMTGLQGSGKTTTAAKLANYLRNQKGKIPLLVPADTARPAAREQLVQLAHENGLKVLETSQTRPIEIVKEAMKKVRDKEIAANVVIVDTAGRLHIDQDLMNELREMKTALSPDAIFYVVDAMAGQDAVRSAEAFSEQIDFTGVIVTKLDGDARGGAALSVTYVSKKPVYFLGVGEKIDALEVLHPDRLASRILGMGDVVTLVEKAQEIIDQKTAEEIAAKLRKNEFTIEDFGTQLAAMKKMGSMSDLLDYMPGASGLKKMLPDQLPEAELKKTEAIISSMTPRERRNHQIIDGSRRKRIAMGSGTEVSEVNRFLKQFLQTRTMMGRLSKVGMKGMRRGGMFPFS